LYYRLNVVPVNLPALRERPEDIPILIKKFLTRASGISNKPIKQISEEAIKKLIDYDWPGNIRELENIIERCVVVISKDIIEVEDLPMYISNNRNEPIELGSKLDEVVDSAERDAIVKALIENSGNRTKASEILGISRRSLHRKIIKYNIEE